MKVHQQANRVTSNFEGKKVLMGVAAENMAHIQSILSGLYKDKLEAVMREYATNGIDAHIEGGFSGPIEVTLPTILDPVLKIRDYGVGLDWEGVERVYSQYGSSTKRDSDAQTGMLGIGSKSALAYGGQFTVTSVKNGNRIVVLVGKGEDGAGFMQLLHEEPTLDANGTEIAVSITSKDIQRAAKIAEDIFSYWTPGTVLVNGQQPTHFLDCFECLRISDSLYLTEDTEEDLIVMGHVRYPHELDLGIVARRFHLIALVPIGTVMPTPDRERLEASARTTRGTTKIAKDYKAAIHDAVQREIDTAKSPQEAIRTKQRWAKYLPKSDARPLTYRGLGIPVAYVPEIPDDFDHDGQWPAIRIDGYNRKKMGWYAPIDARAGFPVEHWPNTLWITGFAAKKFNADHRKKIDKWLSTSGHTVDRTYYYYSSQTPSPIGQVTNIVLLSDDNFSSPFVDPTMVVPWESIRAIRLNPQGASTKTASGRIPGSYDVWTEAGSTCGAPGSELRRDKPLLWIRGNHYEGSRIRHALKTIYPGGFTLVCLSANRVAKWQRDVPGTIRAETAVRDGFKLWEKSLTNDQRAALCMRDRYCRHVYKDMDPSKVNDPDFKEAIRIANIGSDELDLIRQQFRAVLGSSTNVSSVSFPHPAGRYPLFDQRKNKHAHTYIYLNAAYAAGV